MGNNLQPIRKAGECMLELFRIYGTIELKGADKADKDLDRVDGKAKGIVGGIKDFTKGVGKVAAGIGVFALVGKAIDTVKQSLDGAIDRYDTLNNFPRVMEQIGFDAQTSQKAIDKLSAGIQGLPTRLDEVASTAQGIAIMTGDLDGAVNTTLALNNAFLASNASVQDASRGLDQYVQMLAKGEVDLQSWRTLQETMPFALRKTAEAFGFAGESATNDFYEALKEGEITFAEFNAKLIELDQAQGGFAETAQTAAGGIKTAWTNMKTWVVMGVADILGAFDQAIGGTGSIEKAILKLKPIIQGVFGWIANTAIPSIPKGLQWIRERIDDLKTAFDGIKGHLEPLFAVFQREFERLKSNMAPSLEALKKAWDGLKPILITIGQLLGVVIVGAVGILVGAFTGLIALLGPLINALSNLFSFVTNIIASFVALLRGDLTGAFEYWSNAAEATVNFFKSLFEGVIVFLASFIDGVVKFFRGLYMILVGNSIIPDMVNAIIDWFKNLFKWAIDLVKNFVKGIVQDFQNLYNRISSVMTTIRTIITTILNYVKNTFKNALMFLKGLVTGDFGMMQQAVQNQMNNIRNTIRNIVNALPNVFNNGLAKVRSALSSGMSNALKVVTGFASRFVQAGRNLVNSIASGIRNAIGNVTSAISSVTSKIRNFLPFSPAKEGPLSDLDKLDFEGPIGDSIERGENTLRDKMMKLLGSIHPTASINVGGRGITTTSSEQSASTVATSQNNEMIGLLKEVVRAIREGKIIHVDGRILGEINDEEQGRRVNLSGRVAY